MDPCTKDTVLITKMKDPGGGKSDIVIDHYTLIKKSSKKIIL